MLRQVHWRTLGGCGLILAAGACAALPSARGQSRLPGRSADPLPELRENLLRRNNRLPAPHDGSRGRSYGHHGYGGHGYTYRGYGHYGHGVGHHHHAYLPGWYSSFNYSPWGIYYNSYSGVSQYYLPPVVLPGELLYGPTALDRFLGQPAAPRGAAVPQLAPPPALPRVSNAEARARAARFVGFGDALFARQEFHQALQRYKSAAEAAPDVAEVFFRQGHALVATRRYDLAVKAFKIALQLNKSAARGDFQLDDLYQANQVAKKAHLEALAEAAMRAPDRSDLLFLVGVFLHYDGQPDRAVKFFSSSRELAGDDGHLTPFLAGAAAGGGARPARRGI